MILNNTTFQRIHTAGKYYIHALDEMARHDRTTLHVDFKHLRDFDNSTADTIEQEFYRVEPYLNQGLFSFVVQHNPTHAYSSSNMFENSKKPKSFLVSFFNLMDIDSIRDLKTEKIGKLMSITGTVTRSSQVRPELILGTFKCEDCQSIVRNVKQQFTYTEPLKCSNVNCNNRKNFTVDTKASTFMDWQSVRVQENADKIPAGSMPRR
jgi:DNA replication licensing factor MCM6